MSDTQPCADESQFNPSPGFVDSELVKKRFAFYRPRILLWTTLGYGAFYFVRKNLSVAMPVLQEQLGIAKVDLGLFLTLHGLLYGVSKFINGILCDRADARIFMAIGLIASAAINVCFGMSGTVIALGAFWMLNGWFQGMGYPPCARLLTHWFSPKELATKMSIWNASHSLGAGTIVILCGFLVTHFHNWRLCFFVPAAIATLMSIALLRWLVDAPESVGLPEVEGTRTTTGLAAGVVLSTSEFRSLLYEKVFADKYIWIASAANFFVYVIRYAVLDWGPTMLMEAKGVKLSSASWMIASFELAGLTGILTTGWLTDRVFKRRAAPMCLLCMMMSGVTMYLLRVAPQHAVGPCTVLLMAAGFFIYGPQALVAVIVANRATKRAAATAVGLTSVFGYASTVISGWGMGLFVQKWGWNAALIGLVVMAGAGALLFALALPAKAHGYAEE